VPLPTGGGDWEGEVSSKNARFYAFLFRKASCDQTPGYKQRRRRKVPRPVSFTFKHKLHYFNLLWICCTICTTNPQQIEIMESASDYTHAHTIGN